MGITLQITEATGIQGELRLDGDVVLLGRSDQCTLRLTDGSVSRLHARIDRKGSDYVITDLDSANGLFLGDRRIKEHVLRRGDDLFLGDVSVRVIRADAEPEDASLPRSQTDMLRSTRMIVLSRKIDPAKSPEPVAPEDAISQIIGGGSHVQELHKLIRAAAESDLPVLIRGETGTGKELVARCIAEASPGRCAMLVAVSLPSLDRNLVSSELFGHVKGAFTGADGPRQGWFEVADGSTLLLDEIGDALPDVQAKLLRVLETGEIILEGGAEDLMSNPEVKRAYLGKGYKEVWE